MNSHQIKLKGKFEVPEPLEIDKSYDVSLKVDITAIRKLSNQNGEYQFSYIAEPLLGEVTSENGDVIKLKDNKKQSVKFRQQLGFIAKDRGVDPGQFYEETMTKIRHYTMEILDFIESLDKH